VREGDMLVLCGEKYCVDCEATERRRAHMRSRLDRLNLL
jgi:hypothetical protein